MQKKNLSFIILISFWGILILSGLSYMAMPHFVSLNLHHDQAQQLSKQKFIQPGTWNIVHFLSGECECSQYLATYLLQRGPLANPHVKETIVLLGGYKNYLDELKQKSYETVYIDRSQIKKKMIGLNGVPMLFITNEKGALKYIGGYSTGKINAGTKFLDLEKFKEASSGSRSPAQLPVVGCAVSEEYKKILDPLGISFKE